MNTPRPGLFAQAFVDSLFNMKTIAVTIDEPTLDAMRRLLEREGRRSRRRQASRSELVRRAVQDYVAREQKRIREAEERFIWEKHHQRINRQAAALIAEQASV